VLTPNKQSATWVFTTVTDGSGWGSRGFSFLLGFLSVAWTMTDYDATTHMSEETHRAATLGPLSIRLAILVSGITGWLLTITLCFCLNDWDGIVRSRTGLPAAQIFLNAGGPAGGTVMWAFCILVQCFTATAAMLGNARMAYAFARDGAFPFSGLWSTISATTGTPVYAVWLVVGFCTVLLAIGFGSLETIVSVFSICAPALDISYIAVIVAHRVYEHRVRFVPGPYTLGRWSRPVNYVSICWVTFISVILFFPPVWPVTAKNMNYAVVVAAFVGIFSLGWWWAGARKTYIGPRTKDVVASSGSSSTAGVVEDEEEEAGAGGPAHGREGRESGVASPEPATSRGVSSEAGRV
jgi:amino acid transporter